MTKDEFAHILQGAAAGRHDDLEVLLKLYKPVIRKFATVDGIFDEDLYQHLLIHIARNIDKFTF